MICHFHYRFLIGTPGPGIKGDEDIWIPGFVLMMIGLMAEEGEDRKAGEEMNTMKRKSMN